VISRWEEVEAAAKEEMRTNLASHFLGNVYWGMLRLCVRAHHSCHSVTLLSSRSTLTMRRRSGRKRGRWGKEQQQQQ